MRIIEPLTFWQSVVEDPDRLRPFGALIWIAAVVLFLIWLFLASLRRRLYKPFGATIIVVALIGYLAFDLRHISLNFRMRDTQNVRVDCIELMKRRQSFVDGKNMGMHFTEAPIPLSFARIGATEVTVEEEYVAINLIRGWNGSEWGFLYFPHPNEKMKKLRSTCYRDFYEYRLHGE